MKMLLKLYWAAGVLATRTIVALPLIFTSGSDTADPWPSMIQSSPLPPPLETMEHVAGAANARSEHVAVLRVIGPGVVFCVGRTGGFRTTAFGSLTTLPWTSDVLPLNAVMLPDVQEPTPSRGVYRFP